MENDKKSVMVEHIIHICLAIGILCVGGLTWHMLLEIAATIFVLYVGSFYDAVVEFAACIGSGAILYFVKRVLNITISK